MSLTPRLALLLVSAFSLSAPGARASGYNIVATGVVTESHGGPGPLGVAAPGDPVQFKVAVKALATPILPGTVSSYALQPTGSEFYLNGVPHTLAPGVGLAHMLNDYASFGDEIQVADTTVSGANVQLHFVFRSATNLWNSTDLADAVGSYLPATGDLLTLSIEGSGADFQVSLQSLQVMDTFSGNPYCAGQSFNCPCGNLAGLGEGCANSTGVGAVLGVAGSPVLAANNLRLRASGLPANSSAMLFHADGPLGGGLGSLLGDGLLCITGNVQRYTVVSSNAAGSADWDATVLLANPWSIGVERHFQVWYRDAPSGQGGNSPCGLGFNLSQAVRISAQI